nr:MAG TPA: hypothetical protein [Caudoviricetes sp.]
MAKPNYLYIKTVSKKRTTIRKFWTTHPGLKDRVNDLRPN